MGVGGAHRLAGEAKGLDDREAAGGGADELLDLALVGLRRLRRPGERLQLANEHQDLRATSHSTRGGVVGAWRPTRAFRSVATCWLRFESAVDSAFSSSSGRTRKRLSRYMPQKAHSLKLQPMVACRIRLLASEGGR